MFYVLVLIIVVIFMYFAIKRSNSATFGSPFVPLDMEVVDRIMEMVKVKKGDVFYDLGSGDGRLVIAAAKRGAKAFGVEISFFRVWGSRLKIFWLGLNGRAKIIRSNLFKVDLSKATVVTAYLSQKTNEILLPKFKKELKNETKVVGVAFNFSKWKPVEINPNGSVYGPIYLYKVKKDYL